MLTIVLLTVKATKTKWGFKDCLPLTDGLNFKPPNKTKPNISQFSVYFAYVETKQTKQKPCRFLMEEKEKKNSNFQSCLVSHSKLYSEYPRFTINAIKLQLLRFQTLFLLHTKVSLVWHGAICIIVTVIKANSWWKYPSRSYC